MTTERQAALEKIGFEWRIDKPSLCNDSLWQSRYDELIAFKQQHCSCNVPRKYEDNKSLGEWVSTQRCQYRLKCKGESSRMTAEHQAALEKIGFEWSLDQPTEFQSYDPILF